MTLLKPPPPTAMSPMPLRIPAMQLRRCSVEVDSDGEQEHLTGMDEDDAAIDVEADEEPVADQPQPQPQPQSQVQSSNDYVRSTPSAAPPPSSSTFELHTKNNNCFERNEAGGPDSSMPAAVEEESIISKAHSY
ncbi:uncharacterized protein LOC116804906 [Drosophila mojavensis]|nr:uncharacterized protein LOC116804906 [Drosophila mojavensis]